MFGYMPDSEIEELEELLRLASMKVLHIHNTYEKYPDEIIQVSMYLETAIRLIQK